MSGNDEFDEIDELLIAEGVMTEEEIREAEEWAKEADVEEMIDNPDRVLKEADEEETLEIYDSMEESRE